MIFVALALAMLTAPDGAAGCRYERLSSLALDLQAFDQDMGGGWRTLEARGAPPKPPISSGTMRRARESMGAADARLSWHEGQLRAAAGQYAEAIRLFDAGRHPAAKDAGRGWNLYLDGSIASLWSDRVAVEAARAKLAILPRQDRLPPLPDMVAWYPPGIMPRV
ncbi:MAG: hypothetical protein ABW128_05040 [Rhizorhabdus sp.]